MGSETSNTALSALTRLRAKHTPKQPSLQCNGINNCEYLQRLQQSFQTLVLNANEQVDDFLHLLHCHDDNGKEFETIYNVLGGNCNTKKCQMLARNYRDRSHAKENVTSSQQIADKIHCFFIHSYDVGHRLTTQEKLMVNHEGTTDDSKHDDNDDDFAQALIDKKILRINQIISSKREMIKHESNILHSRLSTKYNQLDKSDDHKMKPDMYNFGVLFKYNYKNENIIGECIPVASKYSCLKEELTTNDLNVITIEQFSSELQKAGINFNSQYKKSKAKWKNMHIEHILSMMIYSNYDALQNMFSKTYYVKQYIHKHNRFYHFGKFLKIAVNMFGDERGGGVTRLKWKLYHGIAEPLSFARLFSVSGSGVRIYSPLSTTNSFSVATSFTNSNTGIIIQFGHVISSHSRCFNMRWLSDFANESEHLFIQNQGQLAVDNITNAHSGTVYELVLKSLQVIQAITPFIAFDHHFEAIHDISQRIGALISKIISYQLSRGYKTWAIEKYEKQLIDIFCTNKTLFGINCLNKKYWPFFHKIIFDCDYGCEWIQLDLIKILFPNVFKMAIYNCSICEEIMDDILNHLKDETCNIKSFGLYPTEINEKIVTQYREKFKQINFIIEYTYKQPAMFSSNLSPHYVSIQHTHFVPTSLHNHY
eukprot:271440_1